MRHKLITEEQAQELSNILTCFIVVNKDRSVLAFKTMPVIGKKNWFGYQGHFDRFSESDFELPVSIKSDKEWSELVFKPVA